jgi:menaquinone-dependent protoporphyrinogen oxidase
MLAMNLRTNRTVYETRADALCDPRRTHPQRVTERVGAFIQARGFAVETINALHIPAGFSLDRYCAGVIAASVHRGAHEREIVEFVKDHVDALNSMPTAFLSVSLSEAGAEDEKAPPERRAQAALDVQKMTNVFLKETAWHPMRTKAVAGALQFTKYNFLVRFVMKRISRKAGGATDTSTDHAYTDWKALDDFVGEFAHFLPTRVA